MAWYRTGTVTVANGSATVTGAGTDFVSNTQIGEVFLGPDMRVYEIATVVSATQLTIIPTYQGPSGGGQSFGIQPTSSFARDLALGVGQLLGTFAAVRDGIGQGLFTDGSAASPAFRFSADQDTGIFRAGANLLGLVAGGSVGATIDATGLMSLKALALTGDVTHRITRAYADPGYQPARLAMGVSADHIIFEAGATAANNSPGYLAVLIRDANNATQERVRFDANGNLLLGVTSGTQHTMKKDLAVNSGNPIVTVIGGANSTCATFYSVNGAGTSPSAVKCALGVAVDASTSRSINAAGTVNASGADYAEYMAKVAGCGTIAPGDVCGVDADGRLTRTWADAVSFVVKSTDPAYVGGDSWARHLPPRPEAPGAAPVEPIAPISTAPAQVPVEPVREDGEDDAAFIARMAAYLVAVSAAIAAASADAEALATYRTAVAGYPAAKAQHEAAVAAYEAAAAAWDADLEAARQTVDRIAFSGQVPVNIDGAFAVGDYLIAAANGGGIHAVAVPAADITFDQYRRRIGKVWAVRDSRPWVDVQHG